MVEHHDKPLLILGQGNASKSSRRKLIQNDQPER